MNNFEFYSPTRVVFGRGVISGLGEAAKDTGKKALLLYGKASIKKNGLYDRIMEQLESVGVQVAEFGGVSPNPVLSHALQAIEAARKEKVDFIIAAGGGSVIDEAKAVAAGTPGDSELWDYYTRNASIKKALPIIAVQTLPATSSETNQAGVLTNSEAGEKFSIRSPLLVPRVAFLDPEITFSVPLKYTAYACFDMMSHLLEGYLTATARFAPVQEGLVEGLVKAVMVSLDRILKDPRDYDARASVMWAGALAWNGLGNAGFEGAAIPNHMIEHPLSAIYDIPHVRAGLAVVVPAWMDAKKEEKGDRIILFGRKILGIEGLENMDPLKACDRVIAGLKEWLVSVGCPVTFSQAGIENPDIQELAVQAEKLAVLWNIKGYDIKSIKEVYNRCF